MANSNELNKSLDKRGKIYRLNPFLDGDEVIHVGGRLEQSFLNNECKHPMLLPKIGKIKLAGHSGRGITLNEIRSSGYWIVDANSAVKNILYNCVEFHRHRGRLGEQKMANLHSCRLKESAPFTHCGIDMFGPIVVKQRRSEVKCYGAMFTCMASRAIHIEVSFNLDTDSFILALRRLVARRGNVISIYSDYGSNFIGAERELKKAYSAMNDDKTQSFMEGIGGDWIKWHKNPPFANLMSGVWEKQIRSACAILTSTLKTHEKSLDDESLLTLMTEVERILNSRPLTVEMINDPGSFQPLSPANILTMKSKVVMPPPRKFLGPDLYCKRQ